MKYSFRPPVPRDQSRFIVSIVLITNYESALSRRYSYRGPTLLILELLQPGNSKNRVESFTINRNCLILFKSAPAGKS